MTGNGAKPPVAISLAVNGLRIANLQCPEGGHHQVPLAQIEQVAEQGGGSAICIKCRQKLTLEKA